MKLDRHTGGAAALLAALFSGLAPSTLLAAEARVTTPSAHVGSWGLEVSIGKDCAAPDQLILDAGSGPLAGLYQACVQITVENASITDNIGVLRAGDAIVLGEGFSVIGDTDLTLEIIPPMASDFASLVDPSPIDEAVYNARFYVDRDALELGSGDEIEHFTAYAASGAEVFRLTLQPDGSGGVELGLAARQDGGGWIETAQGQEIPMPAGWSEVEVAWTAANGAGELRVTVAGGAPTILAGLDNDTYTVETVRWGAISGSIAASTGLLRLDAFSSWR